MSSVTTVVTAVTALTAVAGLVLSPMIALWVERTRAHARREDELRATLDELAMQAARTLTAVLQEVRTLTRRIGEASPIDLRPRLGPIDEVLDAARAQGSDLAVRGSQHRPQLPRLHTRALHRIQDVVALIERSAFLGTLGSDEVTEALADWLGDAEAAVASYQTLAAPVHVPQKGIGTLLRSFLTRPR